jgi:tetratricopeptide (TPR) repeat protein
MNRLKGFLLFFLATALINSSVGAQQKNNNSTWFPRAVRRPLPKPLPGSRGFERFAGRDASSRLIAAAITRSPNFDDEVNKAIENFNRGKKYFEEGNYEKAVEAFKRAVNKYPKRDDTYFYLGYSYSALGQSKPAIEAFQKVLDLDAKHFTALFNLGNAYADEGQYEKAIESYHRVTTLQANVPRVYYNMGVAYIELNRSEDAVKAFREATRLRADHAMAYYNLGILYGTAGDYEEAAKAFRQALALKMKGVEAQYSLDEAHFNLGLALAKLKRKEEAMEQYQALKGLKSKLGDELLSLISE